MQSCAPRAGPRARDARARGHIPAPARAKFMPRPEDWVLDERTLDRRDDDDVWDDDIDGPLRHDDDDGGFCFVKFWLPWCCAFACGVDPGDLSNATEAAVSIACSLCMVICLLGFIIGLTTHYRRVVVYNEHKPLGPVHRQHTSVPRWVDVVYTYVNGSHPLVRFNLENARAQKRLPYNPHVARYRDDGLFEFALRSLLAAELVRSVRNVYIVTGGEIPSFLPAHELQPVGRQAIDDRGGNHSWSCHVHESFTRTSLAMPLEPLIVASGGKAHLPTASTLPPYGRQKRQLFIVPHSTIFPQPRDLPTFNSNAILCAVHRLPKLGRWLLYSDDDAIITNPNVTLAAWWDSKEGAQKTYMSKGHAISRRASASANIPCGTCPLPRALTACRTPLPLPIRACCVIGRMMRRQAGVTSTTIGRRRCRT